MSKQAKVCCILGFTADRSTSSLAEAPAIDVYEANPADAGGPPGLRSPAATHVDRRGLRIRRRLHPGVVRYGGGGNVRGA
jgi:hypothetical protein